MSRYKYNQKNLPQDVKTQIRSICAGYARRKRVANSRMLFLTGEPSEELRAFMAWNEHIDRALAFLEEGMRPYILDDIANGKGYWGSMASPLISYNAYYARKNKALENLATEFHLLL